MTKKMPVAGLLIGLGLVITAAVIGYDAMNMRVPPIHAKVGPRVFPILVACGLALAGALTLLSARRGDFPEAEGDTDWTALGIIAAGLIVHWNILKPLGFIPAGIVLFLAVSTAFGSRAFLRDAIIAVALVTVTYFGFTRALGLQLPPGILAGLI
jgi:putative tricarboxylic transport membrane protein